MSRLIVEGGRRLNGEVSIGGAKNAALPILAATLLGNTESVVSRTPSVGDIHSMAALLRSAGASVTWQRDALVVSPELSRTNLVSAEQSQALRASICLVGPILARHGQVEIRLPGGCNLGPRPIDLHVKGLTALGAKVEVADGCLKAQTTKRLQGVQVDLKGPFGSSVLATANTLMAATLAEGETILDCAAREPEIVDLACFLRKMGALIQGEGTSCITIKGVRRLRGREHEVASDRIEAATFMLATAAAGGDVRLLGVDPSHSHALFEALQRAGADLQIDECNVCIRRQGPLEPVDVTARPYPEFPTDLQALWTALMAQASGTTTIRDEVFPGRFQHVEMLRRLGARIKLSESQAIVTGVEQLQGAAMRGCDLRASAALVIAALAAEGGSEISDLAYLERGYESFEQKLASLGAAIVRTSSESQDDNA